MRVRLGERANTLHRHRHRGRGSSDRLTLPGGWKMHLWVTCLPQGRTDRLTLPGGWKKFTWDDIMTWGDIMTWNSMGPHGHTIGGGRGRKNSYIKNKVSLGPWCTQHRPGVTPGSGTPLPALRPEQWDQLRRRSPALGELTPQGTDLRRGDRMVRRGPHGSVWRTGYLYMG